MPAEDEDAQDLLGRIGRRADRVRAEDRQRLLLRQPLADLVLARQRPAEQRRLRTWANSSPVRRGRALRRLLGASAGPGRSSGSSGECGRSTRTRRSPGLRPWSGRRPPIIAAHRPNASRSARRRRQPGVAASPPGPRRRRRRRAATSRWPASVSMLELAGGRVAVARLADAAGVEQRRPAVEGKDEPGPGRDLLDPAVAVGPGHRQVGVAVEPDRRLEDGEVRPGDRAPT